MRKMASPLSGFGSPFGPRRASGPALDPDAAAYIAAVEDDDGEALEGALRAAANTFVVDCKAAGIWDDLEQVLPMWGARTLSGALNPLKGPAPTNFNLVPADYSRTLGFLGNGSTKYIDTGRVIYPGSPPDLTARRAVSFYVNDFGSGYFYGDGQFFFSQRGTNFRFGRSPNDDLDRNLAVGFVGFEHQTTPTTADILDSDGTFTNRASTGNAADNNVLLFARNPTSLSAARISFYCVGKAGINTALKPLVEAWRAAIVGALT